MKRIHVILLLIAFAIVGSLFTMQASNMLFADILNAGAGAILGPVLVTIPAITITMFFVIGVFYLLRTQKHPDCKKRITRTYSIILMALALVGAIGAIVGGIVHYGTLVGARPFPGYILIFLILNVLMGAAAVCAFILSRKMPEDEGKVKISFGYVMKTLGWFLFICLAFNRFGTFLGSPSFIYWRNFHLTFPFYLFLLVPMFLGVIECCHVLGLLKRKPLLIMTYIGLSLTVVLVTYTAIMGINDTMFISSLSQAMPLERMASKPVELPVHFLACVGVSIAILVQNKRPKGE